MDATDGTEERLRPLAGRILANISKVLVGHAQAGELILSALLAGGHVLLDDVPGTGKTLLAKSLARSLDAQFERVQFTPDLLPSDLTGMDVFDQKQGDFRFHPGPLFTNILLADEINRAAPRTQSSLLECMEERQVTVGGTTRRMAEPYFVIATQNPVESQGTFPLPDAQMDRFMLRVGVGYPDMDEALQILQRFIQDDPYASLEPVCTGEEIVRAQRQVKRVHVSEAVLRYIVAIVERTRVYASVALGVSPRGSLALMRCAQALAAVEGRGFVTPEDVKRLARPALAHRLTLRDAFGAGPRGAEQVLEEVLDAVPAPTENWEA